MPSAGTPISIPTKLLATGVACALALVVCGTAATVIVASDVTNRVGQGSRAGQLAATDASASGTFRDVGATAHALDSLLRPLGELKPADPATVALFGAFNNDQGANQVWARPPEGTDLPGPVPKAFHARQRIANGLDSLSPAQLAEAAESIREPWLPAFRSWARSSPQPALWGYQDGLPGSADARGLSLRSFGPWRSLFAANEYASLLALRVGKSDEAMQHALENISASRHFIEQPVMIDALVGRMYLQRGLQLAALVARSTGDTATAHRALRLDSAARNFISAANLQFVTQGGADISSHVAEQFIASQTLHPALRVDAMRTITTGGCRHLPEIVFGFSDGRRSALQRASASLSDVNRANELVAREQRYLDHMMALENAPDSLPPTSILERSAVLNAFSWIVPPGVRARAALCLRQGYRNQSATTRENVVVGVH